MRCLIVEDELPLAQDLKRHLEAAGYAVDVADNGIDGEFLGNEEPFDAVILDLGLPGKNGLELLHSWRSNQRDMPVLILTARDAWHERVDGLKAGADDYVGKPFHVEEVMARLDALIRRHHGRAVSQLCVSGICLDEEKQEALVNETAVPLTGTEFRLLRYMMNHPNTVLSKSRLTDHVYENDADKDSNVMEVYIRRLRQKLGNELIQTKRGQGYIFVEQQ